MKTITVKKLKQYLELLPEEATIKLGVKNYESDLVDILQSPINKNRIILADKTYIEDLKEI